MGIRDLVPRLGRGNAPARASENSDLFSFHREMNRLFDDFFGGQGQLPTWADERGVGDLFTPRVNVLETDKEVKVEAELPGLDEKDVTVEVDDDVITISGERQDERQDKHDQWRQVETHYGRFRRVMTLPAAVEGEKARAFFKKGILTVTLPKRPQAERPRKRIAIASD